MDLLPQRSDWRAATRSPGRDIAAGLTVAVIALPLALGFGVASGLGARAGITTAVVAGALAAIFGGSNLQVSGPTGAMTVVLVPVVHRFGTDGVLLVGLMAGVILIVLAFARVGGYVRYLPTSLVEGFTAGIAVVITLQQVPNLLGVAGGKTGPVWATAWTGVTGALRHPQLAPVLIAAAVVATMLIGARRRQRIPFSLLAVAAATAVTAALHLPVERLGTLPSGLPAPSVTFFAVSRLGALLPSALAVAALAALESLLSATVADAMSVSEQHDPNRELFGQGLANIVTPMFGGVPATAALARTAVNVRAGARSKLAALSHALTVGLIVTAAAPLVRFIPLSALAGVLIATAAQMVSVRSLRALARATRPDAVILAVTLVVTVAFDLVTAVVLGLVAAMILALRAVARSTRLEQMPLETAHHSDEERALLAEHIVAYRVDGPLFFAAAHRFLLEVTGITDARVVILRMSRVTTIDATGARVLDDAIKHLESRGVTVLLSGFRPGHEEVLTALDLGGHLRSNRLVFDGTPAAIEYARTIVHQRISSTLGT
ncbi:MAG: sulfate permease, SulP family [Frankiaceae bacterium]|nr:sulfate permease, SulP family [Frankiaceae bacterium]